MSEQQVTGILTNAGKQHITQCALANTGLDVTTLVLANIANLSDSAVRDPNMALPTQTQIAYQTDELLDGFIDEHTVAWACVLDQDVGNFDYNWIGLVTSTGILLALDYLPLQRKRQGVNNVHNRSFVLRFAAAKALARIDIKASSWMFDYSPRLDSMQLAIVANATAQIDNMTRHLGLKDVVTSLRNTIELQQVHIGTLEQAGQILQHTQSAMIKQRQEQDGEIQTSLAKMATAQVSTMYRQAKHITSD
ncbi:phage tail-collar fiber domain-containing protein [Moritella viscosa]|uniref:Tail fiber protein H, putative n=1 Tax=Moritella viscosa TaxID=80854 RepID=A0A1L0AF79_9GAMM|nr:phage tail protein [Moritella viscosa]SGZ14903.1 Tail fiber protein H, putative [Moritella viscosa]